MRLPCVAWIENLWLVDGALSRKGEGAITKHSDLASDLVLIEVNHCLGCQFLHMQTEGLPPKASKPAFDLDQPVWSLHPRDVYLVSAIVPWSLFSA